jgi:hypothetical protein
MKLDDQSQMPFGKFSGHVMEKVPAEYLLWIWDDAYLWDRASVEREGSTKNRDDRHVEKRLAVHDYIRDNFSVLETECPDRIIKHRP